MKKTKGSSKKSQAPARPEEQSVENGRAAEELFPIVGIGASAGGLEAFTQLLTALPSDTGMAFILIQHLDPKHASFLVEALTKSTRMPVVQAEERQSVERNHVYVIPPEADIGLLHGRLTLISRDTESRKLHLPIDFFFASLAADRRGQAIGVILSGTASDGTEGLRAIKAEDGITFAQDPASAKFGGMPHSAIDAGVVDYSLPIPELAQELVRLSRHPYVSAREVPHKTRDDNTLNRIFLILRSVLGVDFSEYKSPTIERRLARRMALRRVDDLQDYLEMLRAEPAEIHALRNDLLIHVTSFFRDPEVFDSLKAEVYPEILKGKAEGAPVRMWVAGCSTGEEVYSLAISLLEFLGDDYRSHPIQIFGSDVSEKAIETARQGRYFDSSMKEVTDAQKRRFFQKAETGYRINKTVRDVCVFVRHDLARDPPFSRLDLVSCRNVLIYFDEELQKRIIPTFHYALLHSGFLLLGRTESISGFGRLFSTVDKRNKVFARTAASSVLRFAPRTEVHPVLSSPSEPGTRPEFPRRTVDLGKQLDRVLATRYSPAGVLIDSKMEILQFRGEIGAYLQAPPGEPQHNLFKMARGPLLSELRNTIARAKKDNLPAIARGVEFELNGHTRTCDIEVAPFSRSPLEATEPLFLVTFADADKARAERPSKATSAKSSKVKGARHVVQMERELAATKEYLQSLVEDHSRTNDELSSSNEELVSSNEELQSLNEEMETAKEELQSTNEELTTVNDELHSRNNEVNQINSDLVNILSTVNVPILILDANRRIRRFTPMARAILSVLPGDLGRPLEDIRMNVAVPDLDQRVTEVIDTNLMYEAEVQDLKGAWYRMQIRPYKTTDNKIDGATLSLVDINALKHHVKEAQELRAEAERANSAKDQFLATLSHELRTPISAVLMQAQLLRRDSADPKVMRLCGAIERGMKMQAQLIDDLLDVSRIASGKLKMELQAVDLSHIVKAALESVNGMAEQRSLNLQVHLDESIGMVSGDATRLQQVVSNLLTNAIKFTPDRGTVTLELDHFEGQARIRVSDTGVGIDPAFLPHVFNRFAQEDTSRTRTSGGLGLGLSIVSHLVEAHGGSVKAESPGPGRGATFSVVLPLLTARAPASRGKARSLPERAPAVFPPSPGALAKLSDLRVLVVDDDSGTREAVAEMLERAGAQVKVAESAAAAMTTLEQFRPEVLLCDIAMPIEDGYSFMRRVRASSPERGGNVRALALTALAGEEDRRRALAAGFQMYLRKPVDLERLTAAVVELSHRPVG